MRKYSIPEWAQRGNLVWFGHFHEPPLFLKRKGDWHVPMQEFYKQSHTERHIKMLADLGCNNLNTHFYKGDGLAAEASHHKDLPRLISLCHKYGIKVNAYVQTGTITYENLATEVPEAINWGRKNIQGLHQTYGLHEFRWRPCPSKKGWVDYLKKCCTTAIKDYHFDGIFFDNYSTIGCNCHLHVDGEACYCDDCQNNFRKYLTRKYPKPLEILGIVSFAHIHIPHHLENGKDPLVQAWFDYKEQQLSGTLKELYDHIKSLNTDALVATNSTVMATNNPYPYADYNDVVFWEDHAFPRWEDGCLIHLVLPLKVASAIGVTLVKLGYNTNGAVAEGSFWNSAEEDFRLQLAEAFTFDAHSPQTPWTHHMSSSTHKTTKRYIDFFKSRKKFYDKPASGATVALLYPNRQFVRSFDEHFASFKGMIQILLQNRIPFDIIFPEQIEKRLSAYEVLVLSDYIAISDKEATLIRKFVKAGGALFASGKTSLYNERFEIRKDYALADIFGVSYDQVCRKGIKNYGINRYGKGKAAFMPEVIERVQFLTPDTAERFKEPQNICWPLKIKCHLPAQHDQVASAIKNIPARPMPVEIIASQSVVCNLNRQKGTLLLHLLNYNINNCQQNIVVKINASRFEVSSIFANFAEDGPEGKPEKISYELINGFYVFTLEQLEIYCCLEIRLKS